MYEFEVYTLEIYDNSYSLTRFITHLMIRKPVEVQFNYLINNNNYFTIFLDDHGHQQESIYKLFNETSHKVDETMLPISVVTVCATFYDEIEKKLNIYVSTALFLFALYKHMYTL